MKKETCWCIWSHSCNAYRRGVMYEVVNRERWHILLAIKSSQPSSVCHFRATSLRLRAFHAHGSSRSLLNSRLTVQYKSTVRTLECRVWAGAGPFIDCVRACAGPRLIDSSSPAPRSLRSAPLSSRGEETRIRRPEIGSRGSARRNDPDRDPAENLLLKVSSVTCR